MNDSRGALGGRPWYREVWPWLLMLPPAVSVAGGATMIYLATRTPTALVVEDYARIEELTRDRFERDRQAQHLGLTARLHFAEDSGRIEVSLESAQTYESPPALMLLVSHATNPQADRQIRLVRYGTVYRTEMELRPGLLPGQLPGLYRVELMPEDRTWRLAAAARRLDGTVVLQPHADGI